MRRLPRVKAAFILCTMRLVTRSPAKPWCGNEQTSANRAHTLGTQQPRSRAVMHHLATLRNPI